MSIVTENREKRANAIVKYYKDYQEYNDLIAEDNAKWQPKYKEFNDLITIYYDNLQTLIGYAHHTDAILPAEEGTIKTGKWWKNVVTKDTSVELFYTDTQNAPVNYIINQKTNANRRAPYVLWNQKHSQLTSFDDKAWVNKGDSNYTASDNPFGSNYNLSEPIEYYGDSDNIIWGKIVFNGLFAYRNNRINDSFSSVQDSGFFSYSSNGRSISNLEDTFTDSNIWPSPYEIFRYTRWGSGSHTLKSTIEITYINTYYYDGEYRNAFWLDGDVSANWQESYWYLLSKNSNYWIFKCVFVTTEYNSMTDTYDTIIGYEKENQALITDIFSVIEEPKIEESFKTPSTDQAEITEVTTLGDSSGSLDGTYWLLNSPNDNYYVWYNLGGGADPNLNYKTDIEVNLNYSDTADTVAQKTQNEIDALADFSVSRSSNIITITCNDVGYVFDATDVNAGVTINVTQQGAGGSIYKIMWSDLYDNYYSKFQSRVNDITNSIESFISQIDSIINYDYTVINEESGSDIGKTEASSFKTDLENWLTTWKSTIKDTGPGINYDKYSINWSNSNLDNIATELHNLIDFASDYSNRTGLLETRIQEMYDLLGSYSLGDSEVWNPTTAQESSENNTGSLTPNSLYFYRYYFLNKRINQDDGVLRSALQRYDSYHEIVNQTIPDIESILSAIVSDNKYDLTPTNVSVTTEEEEYIEISWDQAPGASSYIMEMKEGISGSWQILESEYGYTTYLDEDPPASYRIDAYTRGYQQFGLVIVEEDDPTGLNDDFTFYDFYIELNSNPAIQIKLKGMDCQTYAALQKTIQDTFDEEEIKAEAIIEDQDLYIYSNKKGNGSEINLTPGTIRDLFSNLSTSPGTSGSGVTVLEQGKVYYFRIKVNNGYNVTLGDGSTLNKDWDSQSEWHYVNYQNDKAINGDVSTITWDEVTNIVVSGVEDNYLTPSDQHVKIEWSPAVNASKYRIYRATSNDGGYAFIGETSNNYYEDSSGIPGVIYWYKIKSVASSDHLLYNEDGTLNGPLESPLSQEGIRGKILWQTITLEATEDDPEKVKLTWNSLLGATGYYIFTSNMEKGRYLPITSEDATNTVFTTTEYIHKTPATQFVAKQFDSLTDSIEEENYKTNNRYYFVIIATNNSGEPTLKQYYVDSPSSGTWQANTIADDIDQAIAEELDNVKCELIPLENLATHTVYKILFTTKAVGETASISVLNGTFGDSLFEVLGKLESPNAGAGAYPGMAIWYKVQAIEEIEGEVVRYSEYSNISKGFRPIVVS